VLKLREGKISEEEEDFRRVVKEKELLIYFQKENEGMKKKNKNQFDN